MTRSNGSEIVRRIAGGKMCSWFGAEALAMIEAMRVIECERPNSIMICTDIRSLLSMDVTSMNVVVEDIKDLLVKVSEDVKLCYSEYLIMWV